MAITYFKYFFIFLCSCYVYHKLLHIKITICKTTISMFFCVFSAIIPCLLGEKLIFFKNFFPIFMLMVFMAITYHNKLNIAFVTSTIAFGISYLFYPLLVLFFSFISYFLEKNPNDILYMIIATFFIGITQFISTCLIFKIKRLKSGMPFLIYDISSGAGIIVCFIIMIIIIFLGIIELTFLSFFGSIGIIIICGFVLYYWWKAQLKKDYKYQLILRELEILRADNEALKADNERLSAMIHHDNKFIPAMKMAVSDFIKSYKFENPLTIDNKVNRLINMLNDLEQSRTATILSHSRINPFIDKTNYSNVNSILHYLSSRADNENVSFEFKLKAELSPLIDNAINENNFSTLLADLIENAIIATRESSTKLVTVDITFEQDGFYYINILDTGPLFDSEVLLYLGKRRYTTHKKNGGSGIGLMTVFEILSQSKASFIIDETITSDYTKKVSICFDNLNEYRIITKRPDIIHLSDTRNDLKISYTHLNG